MFVRKELDGSAGYAEQSAAEDPMDAKLDQLGQLGDPKAQGVLSEAEFATQKARILGA